MRQETRQLDLTLCDGGAGRRGCLIFLDSRSRAKVFAARRAGLRERRRVKHSEDDRRGDESLLAVSSSDDAGGRVTSVRWTPPMW